MKKILVLNSGSSSIKAKLFDEKLNIIVESLMERIHIDGNMIIEYNGEKSSSSYSFPTHKEALSVFIKYLKDNKIVKNFDEEIKVIGHRVVMGGDKFTQSVISSNDVINEIKKISNLAPLHNPANILGIEEMEKISSAPNVMVFDTSFHQTLKKDKFLYPIPYELYENNLIRKYGFHGTSYKYTVDKFIEETKIKEPNLIIFHLGNGASVCSIKKGKSFDTSMGLTPLAGLMMGTRSGDIDPAISIFIQKELNKSATEVENIMNKESGLKGVSGISNDMRDVIKGIEDKNPKAIIAKDMFLNRIIRFYTEYLNQLDNNIDGIIFTGGMGYNNSLLVNEFIDKIKISNLKFINKWTNEKKGWQLISDKDSQFKIFISETNEELEIAKQSLNLIK